MKNQDILSLLAGGILAYVAWMTFKGKAATAPAIVPARPQAGGMYGKAVNNFALPGQPGYAWQYFDNGVAISPNGDYYLNGEKVWSAP